MAIGAALHILTTTASRNFFLFALKTRIARNALLTILIMLVWSMTSVIKATVPRADAINNLQTIFCKADHCTTRALVRNLMANY
jgi:hypothetical protein